MKKEIKDRVTVLHLFYTIWGWLMFIFVNSIQIFVITAVIIITFPFDKNRVVPAYVIKFFYYMFYFLNFPQKTHIDKNRLKAPKKGERRIYAINHASMFDVILMYLLPGPIKSLMKESYAKIPVIGWIATLAGNVILKEASDSGDQMNTYFHVIEKLEEGCPFVIYPEGTKSKTSKIGRFYHGTFKIALETKSDIVPVVFDTWNVIRPSKMWIRDVNPTIKLLDIIRYEDIKDLSYKEISKIIKIKLLKGLIEMRNERRKNPFYYRNNKKFIALDKEMEEELLKLTEKTD